MRIWSFLILISLVFGTQFAAAEKTQFIQCQPYASASQLPYRIGGRVPKAFLFSRENVTLLSVVNETVKKMDILRIAYDNAQILITFPNGSSLKPFLISADKDSHSVDFALSTGDSIFVKCSFLTATEVLSYLRQPYSI